MSSATRDERRGRAAARARGRAGVSLIAAALVALATASRADAAAAPASAIGDQAPQWIAVSPTYWDTRMAAVLATAMAGCRSRCTHLWVTRDGGATWHDHHLPFDAAHVVILGHDGARESIVTESSSGVQRSEDDGATWQVIGPAGTPSGDASGAVMVAVPNGVDYVVDTRGRHDVTGSAGGAVDVVFARAQFNGWLAAVDPRSGDAEVLHCDTALRCSGGALLAGVTGADLSVMVASQERDVIVRTTRALYRSTDGGRTFAPVALPLSQRSGYTAVASTDVEPGVDREVIYVALLNVQPSGSSAATTSGGVFVSVDGGLTWHTSTDGTPLDHGATAVAAAPDGRVFAGFVDAAGVAGLMCYDGESGAWHATCPASTSACTASCNGDAADGSGSGSVAGAGAAGDAAGGGGAANGRAASGSGDPAAARATRGAGGGGEGVPAVSLAVLAVGVALALLAMPVSTRRRPPR